MTTLIIQLLISLSISSLIVFLLTLWLTKLDLMRRQVYLESFLEIIPRDATSHSNSNIIELEKDTLD